MPDLTRRRHPERPDCWQIYYGDVHVGTIAVQPGMPLSVPQWRWDLGFYTPSHRGRAQSGYSPSFEQVRADFETARQGYLSRCTEADFVAHRRQRDWTARKYAMHERGERQQRVFERWLSKVSPQGHGIIGLGFCVGISRAPHHGRPAARRDHSPMRYAAGRLFADPETAARKLVEIASTVEPAQDGRIYIENITVHFYTVMAAALLNTALASHWVARHGHVFV